MLCRCAVLDSKAGTGTSEGSKNFRVPSKRQEKNRDSGDQITFSTLRTKFEASPASVPKGWEHRAKSSSPSLPYAHYTSILLRVSCSPSHQINPRKWPWGRAKGAPETQRDACPPCSSPAFSASCRHRRRRRNFRSLPSFPPFSFHVLRPCWEGLKDFSFPFLLAQPLQNKQPPAKKHSTA